MKTLIIIFSIVVVACTQPASEKTTSEKNSSELETQNQTWEIVQQVDEFGDPTGKLGFKGTFPSPNETFAMVIAGSKADDGEYVIYSQFIESPLGMATDVDGLLELRVKLSDGTERKLKQMGGKNLLFDHTVSDPDLDARLGLDITKQDYSDHQLYSLLVSEKKPFKVLIPTRSGYENSPGYVVVDPTGFKEIIGKLGWPTIL